MATLQWISHPSKRSSGSVRWLHSALLAAVLLPLMVFIGVIFLNYRMLLHDEVMDGQRIVWTLAEHLRQVVETNESLIRQIDQRMQGMSWTTILTNHDSLEDELQRMIADRPHISSIVLTDSTGLASVTAPWTGPAQQPPVSDARQQDDWLAQRRADQGTLITPGYASGGVPPTAFAISRRRSTSDGRFAGTVRVAVASSYLANVWRSAIQTRPDAVISLARPDGAVLAQSDGASAFGAAIDSATVQRLLASPKSGVTYFQSPDGARSDIYAIAPVDDYPLLIIYRLPLHAVLPIMQSHLAALGIVYVLMIAALVGTILLAIDRQAALVHEQTRRAAAETVAVEGHRLEILGQLAAGVAHDFSNVVQTMEFGAAIIERKATDDHVLRAAQRIGKAARQGRWLTRRMLDLARDRHDPDRDIADAVLQPAEVVSDAARLLAATLGAGYRIRYIIDPVGLPARVRGDRSGLEAVIMNLAINARDAMAKAGEVVIRLGPEYVPAVGGTNPAGLAAGWYARVSVTDTGAGMPPDVLARAGEPFFTTKPRGRGTGLGLAGARSFARGAGGGVHIDSAPGAGTTVTVWLAAAEIEADDNLRYNDRRLAV